MTCIVERRKQERREENEARRRTWQERFAERSDSRSTAAVDVEDAGRKRTGSVCAVCESFAVVPFVTECMWLVVNRHDAYMVVFHFLYF